MTNAPASMPQSLQGLPPKWAHFCLHVEQFITGELGVDLSGKTLVVAFSGGVDSTALLLILHYLSQKNGGQIIAVHLNHQIRLGADEDAQWVQAFCNALNVQCIVRATDVPKAAKADGMGLEEAGRSARYNLFQDVLTEHAADYIVVGHHLDDLAEDVLMRLVRGTAWPGLSGMPGHDRKRRLLRPFLLTPKSKLIDFLTDIDVTWREDETNTDKQWMRNRVRCSILPLFLEENPNFMESIARLWKIGRTDQDYWNEQVAGVGECLPASLLNDSHKAKRLRLYKAVLDASGNGQALADTLFKLDAAWEEQRMGATFQFPGNKTATITASGVVFSTKH